jgi:hypothetical protein
MNQPIELVPLVCVKCNMPIPAGVEEVAWVCAQCGQGQLLDEEKGLASLQVHYAASIPSNTTGKPYWVTDGQATLQRQTYSGNQNKDAQQFWSQPRRFFVPAYACSLESLLQQAVSLILQPPALQEGSPAHFEPVTLHLEDVTSAADFIVVAVEAGRKDKLKQVDFTLKLSSPELWILPSA